MRDIVSEREQETRPRGQIDVEEGGRDGRAEQRASLEARHDRFAWANWLIRLAWTRATVLALLSGARSSSEPPRSCRNVDNLH